MLISGFNFSSMETILILLFIIKGVYSRFFRKEWILNCVSFCLSLLVLSFIIKCLIFVESGSINDLASSPSSLFETMKDLYLNSAWCMPPKAELSVNVENSGSVSMTAAHNSTQVIQSGVHIHTGTEMGPKKPPLTLMGAFTNDTANVLEGAFKSAVGFGVGQTVAKSMLAGAGATKGLALLGAALPHKDQIVEAVNHVSDKVL